MKTINAFNKPSEITLTQYDDDLVVKTALVDHVVMGESGEPTDFVLTQEPQVIEEYHSKQVLKELVKGTTLAEIIANMQRTGDISALNARQAVYGDATTIPSNLSDALDKGKEYRAYLDGLSDEEIKKFIELSKMSESEFADYIKSLINQPTINQESEVKENV